MRGSVGPRSVSQTAVVLLFFFHNKRSCSSCRLFLKDMFLFWLTCLPGVSAGTLTDTKTRGDLGSGAGAGGLGLRPGAPREQL